MPSNINIAHWFPCVDNRAQAWIQYSIWGLLRIPYILKMTSASLERQFLIIQSIIPFNLTISEYCNLAKKVNETKYNWVGKLIHSDLCKSLKFDHADKWYMHEQESVRENETHKIFYDIEMQTDHPLPAKRQYLELIHILWVLLFQ